MSLELINENDKKLRKNWLLSTAIFCFGIPLVMLVFFLALSGLPGSSSDSVIIVRGLICSWISFFPLYYCAHKKHGTKLLTFMLTMNFIYLMCMELLMLIVVFMYVTDNILLREGLILDGLSFENSLKLFAVMYVMNTAVLTWWLILSVKLRTLNLKIQQNIDSYQRCKKNWLIPTIICCIIYPIYRWAIPFFYLDNFFFSYSLIEFSKGYDVLYAIPYVLFSFDYMCIFLVIPFVYYCAYKKPGIHLLSFVLVIQSIFVIVKILEDLISYTGTHATFDFPPGFSIANLFTYIIFQVWWIVLSYRLLKMNMKIQSELDPTISLKKGWLIFTAICFFVLALVPLYSAAYMAYVFDR